MTTLHGKRLQVVSVLATDIAHKAGNDLELRQAGRSLSKTHSFEHFLRLIHVVFKKTLFLPPKMSKKDGGIFLSNIKDHVHFIYHIRLLALDIEGLENFKGSFVGLLLLVQVLCREAEVGVGGIVIKIIAEI